MIAACVTPYGWRTLMGATNILNLGELLSLIFEWMPANFATFSAFEGAIARPDRARLLSRPRAVAAADLPDPVPDLDRADPCQEYRGLRLPGAAGAGKAARRDVPAPPADAAGADRWPARYVTALGALMIVAASLDLDLALHGTPSLHVHDGRRRRLRRSTCSKNSRCSASSTPTSSAAI